MNTVTHGVAVRLAVCMWTGVSQKCRNALWMYDAPTRGVFLHDDTVVQLVHMFLQLERPCMWDAFYHQWLCEHLKDRVRLYGAHSVRSLSCRLDGLLDDHQLKQSKSYGQSSSYGCGVNVPLLGQACWYKREHIQQHIQQ